MDSFNPLLFSTLHGNGSVGNVDEHSAEHPVDLNEKEQVSEEEVSSYPVYDDLPEDNEDGEEGQGQRPTSGDLVGQVQQEDPPEEGGVAGVGTVFEEDSESAVGEGIENDAVDAKKDNEKKKKEPSYSTLNRRINNALQATKSKVETFQAKYGGEPDYILIIRDNMTQTNESGRSARTNRKVVVTGEGSLCEEFLYKGLKFNPKSMNFVRKGKTLEKDFDKLEEWLENRVEWTSSNNPLPSASGYILNQPQLPLHPFGSPQVPSVVVQPFGMLTPSYTTPVVMNNTTPVVMHNSTPVVMNNTTPVIPTSTTPMVSTSTSPLNTTSTTPLRMSSTPLSVSRVEHQKKPRRIIDSDSSSDESDHGVHVKKKKVPVLQAARRKMNPLLQKDLLQKKEISKVAKVVKAPQKKKETAKAPTGKKPSKVSKQTAVKKVISANNNGGKVCDEKENTEPNLECLAPAVELSVDPRGSDVEFSLLSQPGKEKVTNWLNNLPASTSAVSNPSDVVLRPAKRKSVVTNILKSPTKPVVKPALAKTLGLAKPAASVITSGITARTKGLVEKAVERVKPKAVQNAITEEEIASILNTEKIVDIFSTPSRKRKMKKL